MKTSLATANVETGGVSASSNFSIKASGKAFQILSSGLYSDKPLAVVRELSCNAYDAHKAADNVDTPFQIHLPNDLEPWFSVKDYGTGLSDEGVMTLYTTYFESTKTDSNDFIGALGLGSKSPFSYVDSFTVISRHEGWRRTYTAYIGDGGMPTIARMDEAMTDEPNGLEVLMPVEVDDFWTFREKVETVLSRFNPLPVIVGGTADLKAPEYIIQGTGWALRKSSDYRSNGSRAIQGNIPYPIATGAAALDVDEAEVAGLDLDITFPIGELEVTASREALQYDERTIANIKRRLAEIGPEIHPHFEKHFAECETLWEARALFRKLTDNMGQNLKTLLAKNITWGGQRVDSMKFQIDVEDMRFGTSLWHATHKALGRYVLKPEHDRKLTLDQNHLPRIFWVEPDVKRPNAKLKQETEDHYGDALVIYARDAVDLQVILDRMGNPPIEVTRVSEVVLPLPKPKEARGEPVYKKIHYLGDYNRFHETAHDVTKGGLYVDTFKGDAMWNGCYAGHLLSAVGEARQLGLIPNDVRVFGIPASSKSFLSKSKDWVNVLDLIKAKTLELAKDKSLGQDRANAIEWDRHNTHTPVLLLSEAKTPVKRRNSPMGKLAAAVTKLQTATEDRERSDRIAGLMRQFVDIPVPEKKPVVKLEALLPPVFEAYPLLSAFRGNHDLAEQCIEYINLIDNRRK